MIDVAALQREIAAGGRAALAQAITLSEPRRRGRREQVQTLLQRLLPRFSKAIRVGVRQSETAVPAEDIAPAQGL